MKKWIRKILKKATLKNIRLSKESSWVTIMDSTDEYSVHIIKLRLEDEGIPAVIFNQRDSSYNAFGYIYLQVRKEDEERALKLLNSEHE